MSGYGYDFPPGGGGALTNINVSAGTTSNNLSNLVFSDSPTVSFGLAGSTITASAAGGGGGLTNIRVSAGTTSNLLSAITFADSNGLAFGINASTITGSYTQSNQNVTAANGGFAFQTLSFSNANNFSFGTSAGSAITGSYTVPTVTNSSWTVSDNATSGTVARLAFTNLNGITLSLSTGAAGSHTIVGSHNALTSQSNQAFSAAGGSSAFQTLSFSDNAQASWTNNAGQVALTDVRASLFATSNTTQSSSGTQNIDAITFAGAGIASVGITGGSVVVSVPAGGGAGDGGVFAGVSTMGNTAGSTGTVSTGNFVLVGSDNITLSQSTGAAGSAATVTILGYMPRIGLFNNLVAAGDSGNEPHKAFALLGAGTINVVPLLNHPYAGPFPGLITAKTAYMRLSLSGSTATMSQSFTSSFFLGIYTSTGSTLSLLNSVSVSFGKGAAATNNSTQFVGNRYLTFASSAWSSEPVFYPGSVYYLASFIRTSNVSNQTGTFFGAGYGWASNSQSHSGTIDVATQNATTMGIAPWVGQFSVSSSAFPGSIASNDLNKQAAFAAVPMIIFNEDNPQSF